MDSSGCGGGRSGGFVRTVIQRARAGSRRGGVGGGEGGGGIRVKVCDEDLVGSPWTVASC